MAIGTDIERRKTKYPRDDLVVRMEINIVVIVNGEIATASAASERPVHVVQRCSVNRGEPILSILYV